VAANPPSFLICTVPLQYNQDEGCSPMFSVNKAASFNQVTAPFLAMQLIFASLDQVHKIIIK
jgi:hypothetical protein